MRDRMRMTTERFFKVLKGYLEIETLERHKKQKGRLEKQAEEDKRIIGNA